MTDPWIQGYQTGKIRYPEMPGGEGEWLAGYLAGWQEIERVVERAFGWSK